MGKRNLPLWFRMDAGWPDNEKFWELSAEAFRLWVHSVAWAKSRGSDGLAPPGRIARTWDAPRGCLDELVAARLWHVRGHDCGECRQPPAGQIVIHGYLSWQDSKEDLERLSERGRKAAAGRWTRGNAASEPPEMHEAMQQAMQENRDRERLKASSEPGGSNQSESPALPLAVEEAPVRGPRPRSQAAAVDAEFDVWWELWPRKDAKGQARTAYRAARKKVGADVLLGALRVQEPLLRARKAEGFCPLPSTWLNGERWGDEVSRPEESPEFLAEVDRWLELHPLQVPEELTDLWGSDPGAAREWSDRLQAERLEAARAAVGGQR